MNEKALIRRISSKEGIGAKRMAGGISNGSIALPFNPRHESLSPIAIGAGLTTKVNANIGTSQDKCSEKEELQKLKIALKFGADAVMDLSTAGNLQKIRRKIVSRSHAPVGTVPIYEAAVQANESGRKLVELDSDDFFEVIERQARDGVDFMTIHAGLTWKALGELRRKKRLAGIVSRGGAMIAGWMMHNKAENPFYENFEELLGILKKYNVAISLGDALRPGALADASDKAQFAELRALGRLTERAWEKGVQVIVEGPGHVPLHEIEYNMKLQKKLCHNAPFYVLGPIVTDVAPGYDHITSAIGGALAAFHGADFLCYVTPSEHLGLPGIEEVRLGVIASKIAAHAADVAKGVPGAREWDDKMSKARKALDWEKQFSLAIDGEKAKEMRKGNSLKNKRVCSMCGDYCAMDISSEFL